VAKLRKSCVFGGERPSPARRSSSGSAWRARSTTPWRRASRS